MLAGCTSAASTGAGDSTIAVSTTTTVLQTTSTAIATTTPPTSVAPTTVAPATAAPTTLAPTTVPAAPTDFLGEETIGTSFDGRPITASHRGTAGGTVVLVVGVIHGDENDGLKIVDQLATMPLPAGIDLWLLPELNPDGVADDVRGNGNGVDLNRNFPHDWTSISHKGDWQWSGPGPGSEPEVKAYMAFTEQIHPQLTLWYHQNLHRVSPSSRKDGPLRKKYAELTGLSYEVVSGAGSIYTGVAATWTRTKLPDSMSFIVELGDTLTTAEAKVHAAAVLTIAQMV
jgi:protein MpaA